MGSRWTVPLQQIHHWGLAAGSFHQGLWTQPDISLQSSHEVSVFNGGRGAERFRDLCQLLGRGQGLLPDESLVQLWRCYEPWRCYVFPAAKAANKGAAHYGFVYALFVVNAMHFWSNSGNALRDMWKPHSALALPAIWTQEPKRPQWCGDPRRQSNT